MFANFEILGRVSQEITLRDIKLKNGEQKTVCTLLMLTKNNKEDAPSFYEISAWEQQAKYLKDYIKKGDTILVKGFIRYYKDKDNISKYENVLCDIHFISHAPKNRNNEL